MRLIPVKDVHTIYTKTPSRICWLDPAAAKSWEGIGHIIVSDMFRDAEGSLRATQKNKGALPPSYSAHNYGLAVDVAVSETMLANGWRAKFLLDDHMREHGWHCHRDDSALGPESWHYNFLGHTRKTTKSSVEVSELINKRFSAQLNPSDQDVKKFLNGTTMEIFNQKWHSPRSPKRLVGYLMMQLPV